MPRLRRGARLLLAPLVAISLFTACLEVFLTTLPGALPPRWGNYAYSKYDSFRGGMYYGEPTTRMNFLRPGFSTRAYYNGYRWVHATDADGFRNPPDLEETSLWLLGDSFIYGQGVEEDETVAAYLRDDHSLPAYNMARQGDGLYQQYILLRLRLLQEWPSSVVLFVFMNDFNDLEVQRTAEQIDSRPEAHWDYGELSRRLPELALRRPRTVETLFLGLKGGRLLRGVWSEMASSRDAAALRDRHWLDVVFDHVAFARATSYYESTLGELQRLLQRDGAELFLIHLVPDLPEMGERGDLASRRVEEALAAICGQLGVSFASTAELFAGCSSCVLPGDGHLSAEGHRRLANFTAQLLGE